ncbi:ABC transporter ATP-binding protein [Amphibacillus sp. Q70]|uniref:ABC transporter ATP-binding protein n=1 Tax=Amphibacillus sp. Q70 TaxID=3453416 RepID=UPI003F85C2B8
MNSVIAVSKLSKRYSQFQLNEVSFDVPKGFITGFIGPNGSGKTTTIKSILSYIKPNSGDIAIFNESIQKSDISYMQNIGVVLDTPSLVKDWTMKDVEQVYALFYQNWQAEKFFNYLSRFGIHDSLSVKELSRGMTVKLMIAAALSHEAKLLVLDEPTSGLDPIAREEICELLQEFVSDENHSVFFSTHITSDLEAIADYIVFVLNGKIVYSGTKDHLLEEYVLVKGGPDDLKLLNKDRLIGLKEHPTGFKVLMQSKDIKARNETLIIEPVTLEQLIIFFNRGGQHE